MNGKSTDDLLRRGVLDIVRHLKALLKVGDLTESIRDNVMLHVVGLAIIIAINKMRRVRRIKEVRMIDRPTIAEDLMITNAARKDRTKPLRGLGKRIRVGLNPDTLRVLDGDLIVTKVINKVLRTRLLINEMTNDFRRLLDLDRINVMVLTSMNITTINLDRRLTTNKVHPTKTRRIMDKDVNTLRSNIDRVISISDRTRHLASINIIRKDLLIIRKSMMNATSNLCLGLITILRTKGLFNKGILGRRRVTLAMDGLDHINVLRRGRLSTVRLSNVLIPMMLILTNGSIEIKGPLNRNRDAIKRMNLDENDPLITINLSNDLLRKTRDDRDDRTVRRNTEDERNRLRNLNVRDLSARNIRVANGHLNMTNGRTRRNLHMKNDNLKVTRTLPTMSRIFDHRVNTVKPLRTIAGDRNPNRAIFKLLPLLDLAAGSVAILIMERRTLRNIRDRITAISDQISNQISHLKIKTSLCYRLLDEAIILNVTTTDCGTSRRNRCRWRH